MSGLNKVEDARFKTSDTVLYQANLDQPAAEGIRATVTQAYFDSSIGKIKYDLQYEQNGTTIEQQLVHSDYVHPITSH